MYIMYVCVYSSTVDKKESRVTLVLLCMYDNQLITKTNLKENYNNKKPISFFFK